MAFQGGYNQHPLVNQYRLQQQQHNFHQYHPNQHQSGYYSAPYYVQQTVPHHVRPEPSRVTETKYVLTRQGPMGSTIQSNAAHNFFARSQRLPSFEEFSLSQQSHLHNQQVQRLDDEESVEDDRFITNFRSIVSRFPPQMPVQLQRKLDEQHTNCNGKIRIIVRVANLKSEDQSRDVIGNNNFQLDRRRCQVTLFDPSAFRNSSNSTCTDDISLEDRKIGVAAPKMFAFDGVFTCDDPQAEVAAASLTDVVTSVMNGNDGCLFCYGHANLGKSRSMLGSDDCTRDLGLIPIAITWLYKAIKERRAKTGAKFSVRVSAMEVTSQRENIRDLLLPYASDNDQSPGAYLRHLPGGSDLPSSSNSSVSKHLQNQSELRASSAEKAAYYLDAALSGRSADVRGRESHLVYTMHVYQYSAGAGGAVNGGRSRLHLIDFGGCERTRLPGSNAITLSGLGNVILGIFNGQKHLPHKESKVTQILRECLSSVTCQATMLAHVSPEACHYSETLHTVQLASRLHRLRRKRLKSSSEERRRLRSSRRSGSGSGKSSSDLTTSGTSTNYSSSEQSCDTVVYRGQSDGSGTDGEHPPMFFASRSLVNSREGSLRGSLDEIPRPASAGGRRKKILTNGAISPRQCLSPTPRSPRSLSGLPSIPEVVNGGKMPLSGLVPIQSSQRIRQAAHLNNMQNRNKIRQNAIKQKEVWIDSSPPIQKPTMSPARNQHQPLKSYGYMDEHKANMINTWVEHQSNPPEKSFQKEQEEPVFRVLTQFKTIDSDESSETNNITNAQIHQPNNSFEELNNSSSGKSSTSSKKTPPPPPPRRTTPPKDTQTDILNNIFQKCEALADKLNEEEKRGDLDRVTKPEAAKIEFEEHPLRVLSEENLTVVSSFGGSLNELDGSPHDKIDPSKLSFFKVPDINQISEASCNEMINQRFKEFAELHQKEDDRENGNAVVHEKEEMFQDPRFANISIRTSFPNKHKTEHASNKVLSTFGRQNGSRSQLNETEPSDLYTTPYGCAIDKRIYQNLITNDPQPPTLPDPRNFNLNEPPKPVTLTPQKQFQLLSQSLRHPDGSSNPELNVIPGNDDNNQAPQRSPGNGRSSSDMEEEPPINNNNPEMTLDAISPNNNSNPICDNQVKPDKPKSGFGMRFLRIFSSTRGSKSSKKHQMQRESEAKRSKSCENRGDRVNRPMNSMGQARSASNSPAVTDRVKIRTKPSESKLAKEEKSEHRRSGILRGFRNSNPVRKEVEEVKKIEATPSTMSISTEWEFQGQDEDKKHEFDCEDPDDMLDDLNNIQNSFNHLMFNHNHKKVSKDRKSSGYDSLGGESSSLDSNQEIDRSPNGLKRRSGARQELLQNQYSIPNDGNANLPILQYNEADIMRMDQRLKSCTSSTTGTTTNSSTYSSLS